MNCLRCDRPRPRQPHRRAAQGARGLCAACYDWVTRHGCVDDYARVTWPSDELLAEWDLLRRDGHTMRQAAERLGVSYAALDKAIQRAKGDPRAIRRSA